MEQRSCLSQDQSDNDEKDDDIESTAEMSPSSLANVKDPNSSCQMSGIGLKPLCLRTRNKPQRFVKQKHMKMKDPVSTNTMTPTSSTLTVVPDVELQDTNNHETDLISDLQSTAESLDGASIRICGNSDEISDEEDEDREPREDVTSVSVGTQTEEIDRLRTEKFIEVVLLLDDSDEENCETVMPPPISASPLHSCTVSSSCNIPEVLTSTANTGNVFNPYSEENAVVEENETEVFNDELSTTLEKFRDSVDPKSTRPLDDPDTELQLTETLEVHANSSLNILDTQTHTEYEVKAAGECASNLLSEYDIDNLASDPVTDNNLNLLQSIAGDWDDPVDNSPQDIYSEDEQSLQGLEEMFEEVDATDPLNPETSSTCPRLKHIHEEDMEEEKEGYIVVHRITVTVYKCNICLRYDFASEKEFVNHFRRDHEILFGLKCDIKSCPSDEEFDLEQKDVNRYEQLIQKPVPGRVYLHPRRHMQDSEKSDSEWEDISSGSSNDADSDGFSSHLDGYDNNNTTTDDNSDFEIDSKSRIKIRKKSKSKGKTNNSQLIKKIPVAPKVVQTTRRSKAQRSKAHSS